jgi:ribosome biogenesis protein BMS1
VGKTALIKGLVKHYTRQNLADPLGPITLVTGVRERERREKAQSEINKLLPFSKRQQ